MRKKLFEHSLSLRRGHMISDLDRLYTTIYDDDGDLDSSETCLLVAIMDSQFMINHEYVAKTADNKFYLDKKSQLQCLPQIDSLLGEHYLAQSDWANSERLFNQASKGYETQNKVISQYYCLYKLGLTYYRSSEIVKALEIWTNVAEKNLGSRRKFQIKATNGLANCHYKIGDYKNALNLIYQLQSQYLADSSFTSYALITNLSGIIHKQNGNYEEAETQYKTAIEYQKKAYPIEDRGGNLARYQYNLAILYDNQNMLDKALEYMNDAIESASRIHNQAFKKQLLSRRAVINGQLGLHILAQNDFDQALDSLDFIKSPNIGLVILSEYIQYLIENNGIKLAIENLERMQLGLDQTDELWLHMTFYDLQYKAFKEIDRYEDALASHEIYSSLKDSILNQENIAAFEQLKAKNNYDALLIAKNQELEKSQLEQELQARRNVLFLSLFVGSLLTSILLIIIILNRRKLHFAEKERKKELEVYNQDLARKNTQLTALYTKLESMNSELEEELKLKLVTMSSARKLFNDSASKISALDIPPATKKDLLSPYRDFGYLEEFSTIENKLFGMNKSFINSLMNLNPNLSTNNLKLCLLLKYGFSYKEIAQIRFVTPSSIKVAAHRLKKSFEIKNPEMTLLNFLRQVESRPHAPVNS